jgi:hypothetical protein
MVTLIKIELYMINALYMDNPLLQRVARTIHILQQISCFTLHNMLYFPHYHYLLTRVTIIQNVHVVNDKLHKIIEQTNYPDNARRE